VPGLPLPVVPALAADYDVSTDTVQKAIAILKAEGLLFGVTGKGTFVSQ
jgi:DNA-binding GntR family transcriptional regulator